MKCISSFLLVDMNVVDMTLGSRVHFDDLIKDQNICTQQAQ